MDPKISIIIPVFNAEKYLRKCLESVSRQSFNEWECILVDDGSTDESLTICQHFIKRDKRYKLISQENGGVSSARNVGLQLAKGEYIHFVDADDYLLTNAERKMYKCAVKNQYDVLFTDYVYLDYQKKKFHDVELKDCVRKTFNFQYIPHLPYVFFKLGNHYYRKGGFFSSVWRIMIKRSLIVDNKILFDESCQIGEDREFVKKVMMYAKNSGYVSKCTYVYRNVPSSLMHTQQDRNEPDKNEKPIEMFEKLYSDYENKKNEYSNLSAKLYKTAIKAYRFHAIDISLSIINRGNIEENFRELLKNKSFDKWFSYEYIFRQKTLKYKIYLLMVKTGLDVFRFS